MRCLTFPLLALILPALAAAAAAQPPSAAETRTVRGRVLEVSGRTPVPVGGVWVILHRVGRQGGGAVDSVRSAADGGYRFRFAASDTTDAIFFAAAQYRGIAYFSAPLRERSTTGETAEIAVFDTTSAPVPLTMRGRHLVVSAPEGGVRRVIEIYEISNDSSVTRIATRGNPVWSALLPDGARDVLIGERAPDPEVATVERGRIGFAAPMAPGLDQVAVSYVLDADAFPLSIPVTRPVGVLEVLLEDTTGTVSGAGLRRAEPVAIEGRTFARYTAEDVAAASVIRVAPRDPPADPRRQFIMIVLSAIGVVMIGALALAFRRRGPERRDDLLAAPEPPG